MTTQNTELGALIIGAGPTGLTLACDLARRGIQTRLVDIAAKPFEGSRGKGIQPRTLEVFEDLGIVEEVLAAGGPYPKFRAHFGPFSLRAGSMSSGRRASEDTPFPQLWMVPQWKTEEILRRRLRALGGEAEFGKALVTFTQDDLGVSAVLSDGETVRAQVLIGCDGGHSAVRKTLGLELSGALVDHTPMFVADVEIPSLDRRDWHAWPLARGGAVALCPLPRSSLFQFTAPAKTAEAGVEAVVWRLAGKRVERIAWSSKYQPAVRMVDRYRVRRVFLAGDSAHLHPPAGGQGLNTGVQDAFNLGWKLAYVLRGGPDSLLDTYEEERLPIAAAVLGLSRKLHQSRSIARGRLTDQLGLNYRGRSLSAGVNYGSLHPGDRMPDRRLADGSRLFDHLRGPQACELVAPDGTRILVRPDGYVAQIGAAHLAEYAGLATREVSLSPVEAGSRV